MKATVININNSTGRVDVRRKDGREHGLVTADHQYPTGLSVGQVVECETRTNSPYLYLVEYH